ncbi:hypothetical protein TNCV_2520911 [Trichonephila clavipes]|nr:hypothetical protein TNCV_2520911 [Trichonephila clavipes]
MENRKETTIEKRKLVIKLSNEGKSQQNIAKVVGRSVNCIQKILQKFKKTASNSNTLGRSVSAETIRRVPRKADYNGRVARKSPSLLQIFVRRLAKHRNGMFGNANRAPKSADCHLSERENPKAAHSEDLNDRPILSLREVRLLSLYCSDLIEEIIASSSALKRTRTTEGKVIEIGFVQAWSVMGQMRDADEELSPLIADGLKIPRYREV